MYTIFISQTVKIKDIKNRGFISLDLEQHLTKDKDFFGKLGLDNEADSWFCIRSGAGKYYLWLGFTCVNEDATSCRYNTEVARWYDSTGHNLHVDRMSNAQGEALRKRLKIPLKLPDGGYFTEKHWIFH